MVYFEAQKFLILMVYNLIYFSLVADDFSVITKKPLPNPRLWKAYAIFKDLYRS